MKSIDDVRVFCDGLGNDKQEQIVKPKKRSHKLFWECFGSGIVCFILGSVLFFPLFDDRSGYDVLVGLIEFEGKRVDAMGDEPPDVPEPYLYEEFIAPPNSFGMGNTTFKHVNWSYFRSLFNSHCDWMLEYKRYEGSSWTNGNQYLTIEKSWNDTLGGWKFNLILDAPVDVYSARFTFGCSLPVLDYVERDGWQVNLNYTVPNTDEVYNCYFNWSDMANIPGVIFSKGRTNDMFWFRFRRDNIPSGHYEFDPWFGSKTEGGTYSLISSYPYGCEFTSNGTGDVTSISWYMLTNCDGEIKVAIYDTSLNLLGQGTTTYPDTDTTQWIDTSLDSSVSITNGTNYFLAGYVNACHTRVYYSGSANYKADTGLSYANFPEDPWTPSHSGSNRKYGVYATYTESGGDFSNVCPVASGPQPSNGSTGEPLSRAVGVTITDSNSNHTMNCTFATNESGSWVNQQTNSSVANNTGINWTYNSANTASTKYYWRVYVHDGICNSSYTFSFTTSANVSEGSWQSVDSSFNGNYSNSSHWTLLDDSMSGVYCNSTYWELLDDSFNGKYFNSSHWSLLDDSVNGTFRDVHEWNSVDDSINGLFFNETKWVLLDDTFNGLYTNTSTTWQSISSNINGRYINYTGNLSNFIVDGNDRGMVWTVGFLSVGLLLGVFIPLFVFKRRKRRNGF